MDDIEVSETDSTIEDLLDDEFFPFGNRPDFELNLEELASEDI